MCATDMAAAWKLVGAGGGCKNTEMFCTLWTCASSQVHQPNAELCQCFCSEKGDDPNWKCYHHPIQAQGTVEALTAEINTLRASLLADLDVISKNSKIKYDPSSTSVSRTRDSNSIYFDPQTADEKEDFVDLLFSELMLRGLSVEGDLEELRDRLLNEILLENKYRANLKKLSHCTTLEASIIALLHKIPCSSHAENRIGIKLLTMVLMEGFSNAVEGLLFAHITSAKERIKAFATQIENILNTQILGDDYGPSQWCIPMSDDNKTVGTITLDNNRIRQIMEDFEMIITASISDFTRCDKYLHCIPHYRDAMVIIRQQHEYTDDDIIGYQSHVDCWFQVWNELHGSAGCTNYTHMLSSGHLAEFMEKSLPVLPTKALKNLIMCFLHFISEELTMVAEGIVML